MVGEKGRDKSPGMLDADFGDEPDMLEARCPVNMGDPFCSAALPFVTHYFKHRHLKELTTLYGR